MPTRYSDDIRAQQIDDWDEWVRDQLNEANARGEFDNLPDRGKPIKIYRTDINPEYDLAFSRLKNAGVMPAWMELDRDVSRMRAEMDAFLSASAEWLRRHRAMVGEEVAPPSKVTWPAWQFWKTLLAWFRFDAAEPSIEPITIDALRDDRRRMKRQFLQRADELDKKIVNYHNALPRELAHLQRLRMLPDRASRMFEEQVPASLVDAA